MNKTRTDNTSEKMVKGLEEAINAGAKPNADT